MQRRHRDDSQWAFPLARRNFHISPKGSHPTSRPRKAELDAENRGGIDCYYADRPSADRVRRAAISRSLLPKVPETRQQRTIDMRTLLSGVAIAIVAAFAITAPASAQRSGPGSTAQTGTGAGVIPPGGFGPSSPLFNVPYGSPGLPYSAFLGTTSATTPPPQGATAPAVMPLSQ
jgi:hypothetical protein